MQGVKDCTAIKTIFLFVSAFMNLVTQCGDSEYLATVPNLHSYIFNELFTMFPVVTKCILKKISCWKKIRRLKTSAKDIFEYLDESNLFTPINHLHHSFGECFS